MSKIRRVDFSPDEFLAGTTDLTLEETGAYWKACSLMYSRGGPILDDEVWIAKVLCCHVRTWRRVRERLVTMGKLRERDGCLINDRTEIEIGRARGRIGQAKEAADESARKRRERSSGGSRPFETAESGARDGGGTDEGDARDRGGDAQNRRVSSNNNRLGRATASGGERANHQPSTTNYQKEDSLSQAARAQPLPDGWWPSDALLDRARALRPDIQPARLKLETQGFNSRQRADNRHSHNWDESFVAWILKTKIEERGINGSQQRTSTSRPNGNGTQAANKAAFGAALNRLRDQGSAGGGNRDRREEGDEARDVEATVLDVGQGSAGNGEGGA